MRDQTEGRAADAKEAERLEALWRRPGFLARRLHQIHSALFAEECAEHQVTPLMYSVLTALADLGPVDQTTLAEAVAIDKTNMADLLERLRKRGLIRRRVSPKDRRVRLTALTQEGRDLLALIGAAVDRAHERTIEALTPSERALFIDFMARIVAEARPATTESP